MKTRLVLAVVAAACVAMVTVTSLLAQRAAQPQWTQTGAALVDVASLSRSHARLLQSLEALKEQHGASAQALKAESERGNQLTEQLRKLQPGSPEYKKLERQIAKMRADFELHGKRATNDIKDQEGKLYYAFSRELQSELRSFAHATGTQLVLRYDPPAQEINDPRRVLHEVQKLIVYQRGLEVTPVVQQAMQRRAGAGPTANRPATQPAQRQPVRR